MSNGNLVKRIFTNLGENNKAVYAVIAIALAKGTFRPIFTMMDKKQDPESKKYAAFREGVTEAIACPTYLASAALADVIAPKFLDQKLVKAGSLTLTDKDRTEFDSILKVKLKDEAGQIENSAIINSMSEEKKALFENYKRCLGTVKSTTGFVGVCVAALLIIPGLCNVVLKPVMKKFEKIQKNKKKDINFVSYNDEKIPVTIDNQYCIKNAYKPTLLYAYRSNNNFGMKVGL